ncbi:MAG: hypothetical protein IT462_17280 [Planctomycetes bacterium]|nr:hypothetical protein [Planctomycetota bacterium]
MRLISFAAATVLIALLAVPTPAEEKQSVPEKSTVVKDETWGYSSESKGLGEDIRTIRAFAMKTTSGWMDGFNIDQVTIPTPFGAPEVDRIAATWETRKPESTFKEKVVTADCEIAGLKARKVSVLHVDNNKAKSIGHVFLSTFAEGGQPRWQIEYKCTGETCEAQFKLCEAAIKTFQLLKDGEKPSTEPDTYRCERMGCQVTLAGFKVDPTILPSASLVHATTTGKITDFGQNTTGPVAELWILVRKNEAKGDAAATRTEELKLRKRHLDGGSRVTEATELDFNGRPAARLNYEESALRGGRVCRLLLIWDVDFYWEIQVGYYPKSAGEDLSEKYLAAFDSFKLLKPAPAKADKPK